MTDRETAGPRQDPPGPAPKLEAVERLRRQLDALESKSRRRTEPRAPRSSPRGADSTQLFGSDPYAKAAYDSHPNSHEPRNTWSTADPYANPSRDTWSTRPTDHGRDGYDGRYGDAFESNDAEDNPTDDSYDEPLSRLRRRRTATPDSDADSALEPDDDPESAEPPTKPVRAQRNVTRTQHTTSPDQSRSTWGRRREEAPPIPTGADEFDAPEGASSHPTRSGRPPANAMSRNHAEGLVSHRADDESDRAADDSAARSRRTTRRGRGSGSGDPAAIDDTVPDFGESSDIPKGFASRSGRRGRGGAVGGDHGSEADGESPGMGSRDDSDDATGREPGRRARGRGGRRGYRAGGVESGDAGLPGGGTEAQAKEVCLRLLTDRARSRAELATKLADRGYSEAVANKVLDRLTEVGLIDDAAFAQQWVQSRHTFSGKGKRALAQELRRKGVGQEEAEEALSAITSDDEQERAADLVRRKLRTLPRDLDREKAIRRLVGMLARRGYNSGTAYAVVKAELAAVGDDLDGGAFD